MAWTAQLQLQVEQLPLPEALRQLPAAGGIKKIAAVDHRSVTTEFGGFCPPAQGQSGTAIGASLLPARWALQLMLQHEDLAPAGPDQQSASLPVRSLPGAPRVMKAGLAVPAPQ